MFEDINKTTNEIKESHIERAKYILNALENLKNLDSVYYNNMFEQRLKDGFGSRYDMDDAKKLQETIFNIDTLSLAEEFTPTEGVIPNCKYFRVPHPDLIAKLGVVTLDSLDDNTEIRWADPKNLGQFAATCLARDFSELQDVRYTTIVVEITDPNDSSKDMVATFFPGDTFDMDKMMVNGSKPENTTVKDAIEQGVFYAKTCDENEWEQIK